MGKLLFKIVSVCVLLVTSCSFSCMRDQYQYNSKIEIPIHNMSNDTIFACCVNNDISVITAKYIYDNHVVWNKISPQFSIGWVYGFNYDSELQPEDNYMYHVMIFKKSTIDQYSEEEIIRDNRYDRYYSFTGGDIEAMGFKIIYTDY